MAKAEAKRAGRHRGGRHRHAEPRALPGGEGVPRSRHPRHLRQAADLDARRRQEARRARRKIRQGVRADPQLHRLSDGPAGARDGGEGPARRHPRRAGRISAGLADRGLRQQRPEAGGVAHRSEAVGRRRRDRRHRHACLQSRPLRLRPRARRACRPISTPSCPGRKLDDNAERAAALQAGGKTPGRRA